MFDLRKSIFNSSLLIFVLILVSFPAESRSKKSTASCHDELDDPVSKTVNSEAVLTGCVKRIIVHEDLVDRCAELENLTTFKGEIGKESLIVCKSELNCDDSQFYVKEEYIIFLTSAEASLDGEDEPGHLMSSSPLPYTRRSATKISSYLQDPSVGQPPTIEIPEETFLERQFGGSLNVICSFSGYPAPKVQWRKNGVKVSSNDFIKVKTNQNRSTLTFNQIDETDDGDYQCIAHNVFGSENITFTIKSGKIHSEDCLDDSYCFHGGKCHYIPMTGEKYCHCIQDYRGRRCQTFARTSHVFQFGKDGSHSELHMTLILIFVGAIIITGVAILIYASVRSCSSNKTYEKMNINGLPQHLQTDEVKISEVGVTMQGVRSEGGDPDLVVPSEAAIVRSTQLSDSLLPSRQRLYGSSVTPEEARFRRMVHIQGNVWNLRDSISNTESPNPTDKGHFFDMIHADVEAPPTDSHLLHHPAVHLVAGRNENNFYDGDSNSLQESCELLYIEEEEDIPTTSHVASSSC